MGKGSNKLRTESQITGMPGFEWNLTFLYLVLLESGLISNRKKKKKKKPFMDMITQLFLYCLSLSNSAREGEPSLSEQLEHMASLVLPLQIQPPVSPQKMDR